ncbi:MAG: HAD hydrolase-like protein [Lachnospiraceae bacterium]|jgi:phosphoglycolate phosphatase
MYDYILFDLDGTLTDPGEGITKSVQYSLHRMGIEKRAEELTSFIGPPLRDEYMRFCHMDEDQAERAVALYRERFNDIGIFENKVIPGIPALLRSLRESGRRLAVATSKPEVYTLRILDRYDLHRYFDLVVGSYLDGTRESKPEVVAETLRQFGVDGGSRAQAVMIGDRSYDMEGARANGIDGIGVYFGYAQEGELEEAGAVRVARTVEELGEILGVYE